MKRLAVVLVVLLLAAVMLAASGQAAAPRGSIQHTGLVLKKLDLSQPPSYPNEFFTPVPAPGEAGGRERLTDDVSAALRVMAGPTTAADYCPPINDILNRATLTTTYFDISQPTNPALDDFKKDWLKVQTLAGC